jgi:hypothetical protein
MVRKVVLFAAVLALVGASLLVSAAPAQAQAVGNGRAVVHGSVVGAGHATAVKCFGGGWGYGGYGGYGYGWGGYYSYPSYSTCGAYYSPTYYSSCGCGYNSGYYYYPSGGCCWR